MLKTANIFQFLFICFNKIRGGSRIAAASKIEHFVIIVKEWKPLTVITKSSVLDVVAVLDPALRISLLAKIISFSLN